MQFLDSNMENGFLVESNRQSDDPDANSDTDLHFSFFKYSSNTKKANRYLEKTIKRRGDTVRQTDGRVIW